MNTETQTQAAPDLDAAWTAYKLALLAFITNKTSQTAETVTAAQRRFLTAYGIGEAEVEAQAARQRARMAEMIICQPCDGTGNRAEKDPTK